MKKYFSLVFILSALLFADNNAVDFLQTGLSARSMALGNATAASGGHIDTVFTNPANLYEVNSEVFSAAVNNFQMVENKMFAWAGQINIWANPLTLGLVYASSLVADLEKTRLDSDGRPVRLGNFEVGKQNYTVALAKQQNALCWYGLSLRHYRYNLAEENAVATGFDLGGRWRLPNFLDNKLYAGLSLKNILRTKIHWSTGHTDTMPFGFNSGVAMQREIWGSDLLINLDCTWQEEQELRFSTGAEYDLHLLKLRIGFDQQLTYGLGLCYYGLNLDYAQSVHEDLGLQQRVSLLLYL